MKKGTSIGDTVVISKTDSMIVWTVPDMDLDLDEHKLSFTGLDLLGLISRWQERVDAAKEQLENRCSSDNHILHTKLWKEIRIYQDCIKELKDVLNTPHPL